MLGCLPGGLPWGNTIWNGNQKKQTFSIQADVREMYKNIKASGSGFKKHEVHHFGMPARLWYTTGQTPIGDILFAETMGN